MMIRQLDSFRFFAFLLVFLAHIGQLDGGYIGVLGFFVLSSFLLTPILLKTRAELDFSSYLKSFYGRRLLRIFPLYYTYLISAGALALLLQLIFPGVRCDVISDFLKQWPYAATYTYDFYHTAASFRPTHLLSHFWSLSVEWQFYLIWPFFIWKCPRERLRYYLIAIILINPVLRAITYQLYDKGGIDWLFKQPQLAVYVLPSSHLDAFAVGALCSISTFRINWNRMAWLLISVTVLLGLVSQYDANGGIQWRTLGYPSFMAGQMKHIWGYAMINITFGCIICAVREGSFLPSVLSYPAFQYLGKISYGLYVFHLPVVWAISGSYAKLLPQGLQYALIFFVSLALSVLSYELIEKRCLALKDRYFPSNSEGSGNSPTCPAGS